MPKVPSIPCTQNCAEMDPLGTKTSMEVWPGSRFPVASSMSAGSFEVMLTVTPPWPEALKLAVAGVCKPAPSRFAIEVPMVGAVTVTVLNEVVIWSVREDEVSTWTTPALNPSNPTPPAATLVGVLLAPAGMFRITAALVSARVTNRPTTGSSRVTSTSKPAEPGRTFWVEMLLNPGFG